jgi:IPT/TIG domain-containing protein
MILTRSTTAVTVGLLCFVAMPASGALGATKKKPKTPLRPTVSSVAPLTLAVGDMLTIRGKNFAAGKNKTTVMFKRDGSPAISVKVAEATTTRLKLIVPSAVAKYFATTDGAARPTKFRLRVLGKRFAKSFTSVAMSPLVGPANASADDAKRPGTPAPGAAATAPGSAAVAPAAPPPDCDGDGIIDGIDGDDDNDRLADTTEVTLKTDPCNRDTDGDGNEDGWEYYSALDLNNTGGPPLPYPGKRPYPNPLDPTDAATDYDGDGLTSSQEHALWQKFGARAVPLNFSDGTKFSGPQVLAPVDPQLVHLNIDSGHDSPKEQAELSDDEKDSDGDRLGNWDEANGRMTPGFWPANYPLEQQFSPFYQHLSTPMYASLDYLDPDSDGDTILDGDDDQDHDTVNNVNELERVTTMIHPYNPCLPRYDSPTCPRYFPVGDAPYAPFTMTPFPANPVPWTPGP